jgi:hypothetical protein
LRIIDEVDGAAIVTVDLVVGGVEASPYGFGLLQTITSITEGSDKTSSHILSDWLL